METSGAGEIQIGLGSLDFIVYYKFHLLLMTDSSHTGSVISQIGFLMLFVKDKYLVDFPRCWDMPVL